ncbi:hypothetical protein N566_05635 [Streptomycetaceae bacterium MP113-05]|nr:hypothetical protein N566_05635 [Streptomycetaceae bacterium MP113-05]
MSVRTVAAAAALAATALLAGAGSAAACANGGPEEIDVTVACNQWLEQGEGINTSFAGPVCIDF